MEEEEEEEEQEVLETFDSDSDVDYSLKDSKAESKVKRTFSGERKLQVKNANCGDGEEMKPNTNGDSAETNSHVATNDDESRWQDYLGPSSDPESRLMLRLPDGSRDIVSMPSSSKLMVSFKCLFVFVLYCQKFEKKFSLLDIKLLLLLISLW